MTSMLDSFYQEDVTDTGARLSVRPTQEMAIIKHDARTGMMSIIVPDKDENDSNARNSEITITKVDFVPLTVVKIEKVSLSQAQHHKQQNLRLLPFLIKIQHRQTQA